MEKRQIIGQQSFPIEGVEPAERDLGRLRAFGRVVNPEFWNQVREQMDQVEAADLALADYEQLKGALFRRAGPTVIYGTDVAFNAAEYQAIVRHPKAFTKAIYADTQLARSLDPQLTRRDEKAKRSVEHAITSKEERLNKVLTSVEQELQWLEILQKEAISPKYAHHSEGKLLILAAAARYISFANILEVSRLQNEWDEDTFKRAENALTTRLFSGEQREKVRYWQQMMGLAQRYGRARRGIIRQRLTAIGRLKDRY